MGVPTPCRETDMLECIVNDDLMTKEAGLEAPRAEGRHQAARDPGRVAQTLPSRRFRHHPSERARPQGHARLHQPHYPDDILEKVF